MQIKKYIIKTLTVILSLVVALSFIAITAFFLVDMECDIRVARCYSAKLDLKALSYALEEYNKEHGAYPKSADGLKELVSPKQIIRKIKKDPWRNFYKYNYPATLNTIKSYDLYSFGKNGIDDSGKVDDLVAWTDFDCDTDGYFRYINLSILAIVFIVIFILTYKITSKFFKL